VQGTIQKTLRWLRNRGAENLFPWSLEFSGSFHALINRRRLDFLFAALTARLAVRHALNRIGRGIIAQEGEKVRRRLIVNCRRTSERLKRSLQGTVRREASNLTIQRNDFEPNSI
jgi:hypothetical protein